MRGVISTAAATPGTLTIGVYFAATDTATVGTSTGLVTGAFTPAASLSAAIWEFEADLHCGAPGLVPNLYGIGIFTYAPTAPSTIAPVGAAVGVGGTSATTGLSTEAAYFVQVAATWGSASASNTITMYETEIWGLN
jgi:hypothetical protein